LRLRQPFILCFLFIEIYQVSEFITFIIALVALITGEFLCTRIPFLIKASIPSAVLGGILTAVVVSILESTMDIQITFATQLRDILIFVIFCLPRLQR